MVQEIILFAKDGVGWGPRPIFGYFHYVSLISLNNFPRGGSRPLSRSGHVYIYFFSKLTSYLILEEINLVRSPSFEKKAGELSFMKIFSQERAKKDNLLMTSANIGMRNLKFTQIFLKSKRKIYLCKENDRM